MWNQNPHLERYRRFTWSSSTPHVLRYKAQLISRIGSKSAHRNRSSLRSTGRGPKGDLKKKGFQIKHEYLHETLEKLEQHLELKYSFRKRKILYLNVLLTECKSKKQQHNQRFSPYVVNDLENTRVSHLRLDNPLPNSCVSIEPGHETQQHRSGANIGQCQRARSTRKFLKRKLQRTFKNFQKYCRTRFFLYRNRYVLRFCCYIVFSFHVFQRCTLINKQTTVMKKCKK